MLGSDHDRGGVYRRLNYIINTVLCGDSRELLKDFPDNAFDSVVTDPPYELGFMGNSWDRTGIANDIDFWSEVLRVLKPGGHLLSFGGTRTYHRMASAIEDAGFEIRDQLQWIYGTGMPKGHNIGKAIEKKLSASPVVDEWKQWDGWNTALKPAHEPIVLARKPLSERTVADNVLKWGTGGLNINGCRIGTEQMGGYVVKSSLGRRTSEGGEHKDFIATPAIGRFPANVLLDEEAAAMLDKQSGVSVSTGGRMNNTFRSNNQIYGKGKDDIRNVDPGYGDTGGASRFFYVAKASKKERTMNSAVENRHPTVKPVKLMEYLVRLITPPGGIVLDPFCGSGSTLLAAKKNNFQYVGIDSEEAHVEVSRKRLELVEEYFNET